MRGSPAQRRPTSPTVALRWACSAHELGQALRLRRRVFCEEQGVAPALESDGRDDEADHLVAVDGDRVVGTCRLLYEGETAKLGRLAVTRTHRGAGVAGAMLQLAERCARERGARRIALHAQTRVRHLYHRAGYAAYGEAFEQAGIEHVAMERLLD